MMMDKALSHSSFHAVNKFQSPNGIHHCMKLNVSVLGNSLKG